MDPADTLADPATIRALASRIAEAASGLFAPVTFMEVCGTHTQVIARAGLRRLLPGTVRLVSGPGCPVCVTPVEYLDRAEALAALPDTLVATFGDLLRVPSSRGSLEHARARGADVVVIYSAQDALTLARERPGTRVVLLAVGFETTAPTIAATLLQAEAAGIPNLWVLPGNKVMPPALTTLAEARELRIHGFLLPGHVSVVTGAEAFRFLPETFRLPAAVTGFEPADVLRSVLALVRQRVAGEARLENLYRRVVTEQGNPAARQILARVFRPADARWRGLGSLPGSGLALREAFHHRDASRIPVDRPPPREPVGCRCGDVLTGRCAPVDCPLFGDACTPARPVGACMVSSEGACAAWHRCGTGGEEGAP